MSRSQVRMGWLGFTLLLCHRVTVKSVVAAASDLFNALIISRYVSRSLESPVCTSVTIRNQG